MATLPARTWGTLVVLAVTLGALAGCAGVGPSEAAATSAVVAPNPLPTQGYLPGKVMNARSAGEVGTRLQAIARETETLSSPTTEAEKQEVVFDLTAAAALLQVGTALQTVADSLWQAYAGLDSIAVTHSDERAASLRDQVKDQIDALELVGQKSSVPVGGGGAGSTSEPEPEPSTVPEPPVAQSPLDATLAVLGGISGAVVAAAALVTAFLAVRKHRQQATKAAEADAPPPEPVESGGG